MTLATIVAIFKIFLELAAFFARRVEKQEIEEALLGELQKQLRERVDAAARASDDVVSGRVQPDPNDPDRRD